MTPLQALGLVGKHSQPFWPPEIYLSVTVTDRRCRDIKRFECLFLFICGSKFHTVFGEIIWEMLISKGASSRDLVWTTSDLFGAENVTSIEGIKGSLWSWYQQVSKSWFAAAIFFLEISMCRLKKRPKLSDQRGVGLDRVPKGCHVAVPWPPLFGLEPLVHRINKKTHTKGPHNGFRWVKTGENESSCPQEGLNHQPIWFSSWSLVEDVHTSCHQRWDVVNANVTPVRSNGWVFPSGYSPFDEPNKKRKTIKLHAGFFEDILSLIYTLMSLFGEDDLVQFLFTKIYQLRLHGLTAWMAW